MTIAINAVNFIQPTGTDFFYNYFASVAASKPEHQFIFIVSPSTEKPPLSSPNVIRVISAPKANNALLWKVWLNYTLPVITRKYKADILINTSACCSLRIKEPQYLIVNDLSFIDFPRFFLKKQLSFLKKNIFAFLKKANTILAASDFIANGLMQYYPVDKEKIKTFQLMPVDHYQPMSWEEKEVIREKYTDGKEYFLFNGEINDLNNLVNLLKAFSFFKRRQKSNMQLVITANAISKNNPFPESFKTYKFRKEVNLLMDLPENEVANITAAAYAFISPAFYEGTGVFALQAMQCEVPVIAGNTGAIKELAGDAALYVDPENVDDIADKMMLVFKDETKRRQLIYRASLILQKNKDDKMNEFLWKSISNQ